MEFSRQDYCSGLPFSPPGYLLNPGIEPASPALAGRFFIPQPPGKSTFHIQAEKCQNDKEKFTFLTFKKWSWNQTQLAEVGQIKSEGKLWCISQLSSVAQSCPTLCDPIDCSTPGFPVHHQCLEPAQTHICRVSDAIQPSHPLPSLPPPAFDLSQHQSLF